MPREHSISAVEVTGYRIPTDASEADGTLSWDATEMLVVEVRSGDCVGLGYSYTAALPAALLVRDTLQPMVLGEDPFDIPRIWQRMNQALRNIGRPGLGAMAMSAVDVALWDLKAKLLGLPLTALWGRARSDVPLYGSGGFTTYSDAQLKAQLQQWLQQGLNQIKIKVGSGIKEDLRQVQVAREAAGPAVRLMVDANGAYRQREALALSHGLDKHEVVWLEEPVSSDDLRGLTWLRNRVPARVAVAAGEYGWDGVYFQRMLESGAVDVLQADATRCGYTGFLQAAQLCDAWQLPLSAHCAPALHAPVCAAVPRLLHLEYFHDHARIESRFFAGTAPLRHGALWPGRDAPGHGLELHRPAAQRCRL